MRLGIDFGTCYSSASLIIDGIPTPVKEPLKQVYSFPSSVFVTQQDNFLIGQAAENQRRLAPNCYCHEFKRHLGQEIPYSLGSCQLLPEELVSQVIQGLKMEAEKIIHQPLNAAIVTVPATYQSYKKELMERAARKAGFEDTILLEEPVAAAIYYAHKNQQGHRLEEGEILLVYDLGGGTFDAALIQKHGVSWQLLTQPVGDANCGGIDFDRQIYQHLSNNFADSLKELLDPQRRDLAPLRARLIIGEWCRDFKHQLSMVSEYADLLPIGDLSATAYSLSQQEFQGMIAPYIDRTCQLCRQLVEQANLKWEQINRILLVGGSCRIPYIQQRLEQEFAQSTIVPVDEPELAICFGAAIYGHWLETEGVVAYCQEGQERIKQGNYPEAIAAFERAIRLNADSFQLYFFKTKF